MKKVVLLSMFVLAAPLSLLAQDDDMYFVPTKSNLAKERAKIVQQRAEAAMPKNTYYSGSDRSVDDYNGYGSSYDIIYPDSMSDVIDFSAVSGVYPDSTADYALTRKMQRFDDYQPSADAAYWQGYSDGREVSNWHSPWYYSSFYPWYDTWYDPWYYGSWGWRYGWYDPWYTGYYGWGWGYPYHHHYGWYGGYYGWGVPYYGNVTVRSGRSHYTGTPRQQFGGTTAGSSSRSSFGTRSMSKTSNRSTFGASRPSTTTYGSSSSSSSSGRSTFGGSSSSSRSYSAPSSSSSRGGGFSSGSSSSSRGSFGGSSGSARSGGGGGFGRR